MAKKESKSQLSKFLAQRRSYLIGVVLGLVLITINSVIGLYVVNLVLQENEVNPDLIQELPVPEIDEFAYTSFREDYIDRQSRDKSELEPGNPFRTDD